MKQILIKCTKLFRDFFMYTEIKYSGNFLYIMEKVPVSLFLCIFIIQLPFMMVSARIVKRSYADQSIRGYISEVIFFSLKRHIKKICEKKINFLSFSSLTILSYVDIQRTCWENEICKEEFKNTFRCKCPDFAVCR